MNTTRRDAAPYLCLLTTMAFFGSAFASSKVVVAELPREVAAVLRFGGGAVILLALVLVIATGTPPSRRDLVRAGLVGLLGVFAYNFFFFWGLTLAPSIDGGILVPVMSPVITTAVLLSTRQETVSLSRVGGLVLGVAGAVVFLVGIGDTGQGSIRDRLLGDLLFLAGAACWAAYSILSRKVLVGVDPLRATTCSTLTGAAALLVVAVPSLADADWSAVSGTVWWNVAYLAVGPTAIAYVLYYWGLRSVGPSTATVMMFVVPVFGALCSVLFLGESVTVVQVMGAAMMIVGAVLAVVRWRTSTLARAQG